MTHDYRADEDFGAWVSLRARERFDSFRKHKNATSTCLVTVLDELAKQMVRALAVTAIPAIESPLCCVSDVEKNLLYAYLEGEQTYDDRITEVSDAASSASDDQIIHVHDCRHGFLAIKDVSSFHVTIDEEDLTIYIVYDAFSIRDENQHFDDWGIYFEQVAGYILGRESIINVSQGFPFQLPLLLSWSRADTPIALDNTQTIVDIPASEDRKVLLARKLITQYAREFYSLMFVDSKSDPFDLLFMVSDKDGWFWALTTEQYELVEAIWNDQQEVAKSYKSLDQILDAFRLKHGGFINHLIRSGAMVGRLPDIYEESFLLTLGYTKDAEPRLAEAFSGVEQCFGKNIDSSSYYYFILSQGDEKETGKVAALFRYNQSASLAESLEKMFRWCNLTDRWATSLEFVGITAQAVKEIERPHLRKAARAAVFARNFSHVTGSHVISNPEFRKAMFGTALESAYAGLKRTALDFQAAEEAGWLGDRPLENYWCEARKILEGGSSQLGANRNAVSEQTRHFHDYLQGRFDFIARAIEKTHDHPEPVFLVEDLIEGFLSQTAFLDTFIADLGLRLDRMEVRLEIPDGNDGHESFQTGWCRGSDGVAYRCNSKIFPDDLIGLSSIAKKIANPERLIDKWVGSNISPTTRTILGKISEDSPELESLRHALTNDLNALLGGASIYEEIRFGGIRLSPDAYSMLTADLRGADLRRLNRILLQAAFERELTSIPTDNSEWCPCAGSKTESRIAKNPILIGLPGGMIGVHAFYSLLENIMRNSAKYGTNGKIMLEQGKPYRLMLNLSECKDGCGYLLKIADNFTVEVINGKEPNNRLSAKLNNLLKLEFIDSEGQPRKEGLGLLEMQACSAMLFPGSLENGTLNVNESDENRHALQQDEPLEFSLSLVRPTLLGIAHRGDNAGKDDWKLTKCFDEPSKAVGTGAHLLVLDGDEESTWNTWLEWMTAPVTGSDKKGCPCPQHALLPCRMLVICCKRTASTIESEVQRLPQRRVAVREDPELHAVLFGHGEAGPVQDGMQPEQALILRVYEAWLRSWKKAPDGGHWDLWIGFERNPEAIQELWGSPLDSFRSDLIHLRVKSTGRNQGARWESGSRSSEGEAIPAFDDSLLMEESYRKQALVFDNHGACFSESIDSEKGLDFQKACRFYQRLSGSETPDLFRLLFRPPNNSFAFSFLIHALVESCLANVAVVDERVAADLLFRVPGMGIDEGNFFSRLASHQKAGVFPVFSFKKRLNSGPDQEDMNVRYGFYTEEHHKKMSELIPWPGKPKNPNLADEGVRFEVNVSQSSAELSFLVPQVPKDNGVCRLLPSSEYPCDVLIIHEGALDILAKQVGVDWNRDYATALYSVSPIVVRTSGRGRHTQHMLDAIPFVEFNEISSAVLTSRNKYSLVRALLGTAGSIPSATQR